MEQEKVLKIVLRQIKEIQYQADRIFSGDKSSETIKTFSQSSIDLKEYIAQNINDERIRSYLAEIPDVNYSRITVKGWHYAFWPSWFIVLYKNYMAMNKSMEEISIARGKYAHMELFVRELMG